MPLTPAAYRTWRAFGLRGQDLNLRQQANQDYVGQVGVPADTFARMVAFAMNEPEDVAVNEILFRPTAQEL